MTDLQYAKALTTSNQGSNPAAVYLASLAPTGRRAVQGRLKYVAGMFGLPVDSVGWEGIRYQHLAAIKSKLQESGLSPSTINLTLYAIRGVARCAFNLGLMSSDDYNRLRSIKPVGGSRVPSGRALPIGEISALLDTCDDGPKGIRDAAIISIMYAAGLRREEVAALHRESYTTNDGLGEFRLIGKGNKERILYVDNGALLALNDWLSIRGNECGPLFYPIRKGGAIQQRQITNQAIYNMLQDRAKQAGIPHCSPHDLRHSFISDLLDRGADIVTVQGLAGHSSVETTASYDRRGERAKKKAIGLLHVPYKRAYKPA